MNKIQKTFKIIFNPKSLFGIFLSIGGVYWAFQDFKINEFLETIQHIKIIYIIMAASILLFSVWLRAIRWRCLFKDEDQVETYPLYRYELIGYFGNNVLPLRLGELLRAYIVGKRYGLSKSYVFGTIVLERILDTFSLVFLSIILLLLFPLEEKIRNFIFLGILIVGVIALILLALYKRKGSDESSQGIYSVIYNFINGFKNINKKRLPVIMISSLFIWCMYWADVHLVQMAFNLEMELSQSLLLLVISSLVASIPSAPGMIGTFHAGVKYVMVGLFGFSAQISNSFAIVLHAYGYILYVIVGAIYFMKSQFHENAFNRVLRNNEHTIYRS